MKPHELQMLRQYLAKGLEGDCLKRGIEIAVENGTPNMRYISAIYDRWVEAGLLTLDAVLAEEEHRRRAKARDAPTDAAPEVIITRRGKGGPAA
jgi:DnaD/phage-associated family protein